MMRPFVAATLVLLLSVVCGVFGQNFTTAPPPGSQITFPDAPIGGDSEEQTLKMVNNGNTTVRITSLATSSSEFQLQNSGSSRNIGAGNTFTLKITCSPTTANTTTGKLSFNSNDTALPTASYDLVCEGVMPPVAFSKPPPSSAISFGNAPPKSTQKTHITLENLGGSPLTFESFAFLNESFDGKIVSGNLELQDFPSDPLGTNDTSVITIVCTTPSSDGVLQSLLVINTNDPVTPTIVYEVACWSVTMWENVLLGFTYLIGFWVILGAVVVSVLYFLK